MGGMAIALCLPILSKEGCTGMDGFSYNGIHCDTLGCAYIPDASDNWFVSPDIELSRDNVARRDGSYFFYTRRKARTFT